MNKPRCILFDFWNTIGHSTMNHTGAIQAMLDVADNPRNVNVADVQEVAMELKAAGKYIRENVFFEFTRQQFDLNVADRLGLKFRQPKEELDRVFASGALEPETEPGAAEVLSELHHLGIKMGVVSNSVMGENAISEILEKLKLREYFDFVMTSADYGFRKPQLQLFKTALALAGEPAEKTWFMGDWLSQDIAGAHNAGLTAVWYNKEGKDAEDYAPELIISHWSELLKAVKTT